MTDSGEGVDMASVQGETINDDDDDEVDDEDDDEDDELAEDETLIESRDYYSIANSPSVYNYQYKLNNWQPS